MSIDPSLKAASNLTRHRNVLSRAERIAKLTENSRFTAGQNDPLGLPKVGNRKAAAGKVDKPAAAAGDAAAPADPKAAAPAKGDAKAAAPAKGAPAAKAAPAAKGGAKK